jgi:hypothetical protein
MVTKSIFDSEVENFGSNSFSSSPPFSCNFNLLSHITSQFLQKFGYNR